MGLYVVAGGEGGRQSAIPRHPTPTKKNGLKPLCYKA